MPAYYNEIDPFAAQWLRNLMAAGHIRAGDVDERSIEDVRPDDLRGYEQCHFFAGIGGWAYALALAGWPPGRPVWTGSCPCQPFSQAGKGAGFDDQRHLWPAWFHLIRECRPAIMFGEQVSSKDADPWVDLVHADLEGVGYAFGCIPFPAAGIGAPHIRDRNYWMAHAHGVRFQGFGGSRENRAPQHCQAGGLGHSSRTASQWNSGSISGEEAPQHGERVAIDGCEPDGLEHAGSGVLRLAHSDRSAGEQGRAIDGGRHSGSDALAWPGPGGSVLPDGGRAGPLHGFWGSADWLACRDGKWRPVEPGTQPLAHGIPGRVGRLRAYGNAIVPEAAAQFVASYLDIEQQLKAAA